jgi:hypothetical protein
MEHWLEQFLDASVSQHSPMYIIGEQALPDSPPASKAILDELEVQLARAGVDDELLLRAPVLLAFVEQASLRGGSSVLFREPAVLLQLGWAPVQIRQGSKGRHWHPERRQEESLHCHPDTLRDALCRCCSGVFSLEEG